LNLIQDDGRRVLIKKGMWVRPRPQAHIRIFKAYKTMAARKQLPAQSGLPGLAGSGHYHGRECIESPADAA